MKKAFSMIEVVIATGIFCSFCLSFHFLARTALRLLTVSRNNTSMLLNASSELERLKDIPYELLSSDASAAVSEVSPGLKTIEVCSGKIRLFTMRSKF
ncbi:MAG: hypothetical protein WC547_10625 [Candidatus Omnitrophota bacterium]